MLKYPTLALCIAALALSPIANADTPAHAPSALAGGDAVWLHPGSTPLRVGAEIQTTGYLLLGMLYVAGVQIRNKFNSLDFVAALRPHLERHPLDGAFEAALQDALTRRGLQVRLQPSTTAKGSGQPSDEAGRWSLQVTQLDVEYVAQGSTAAYLPQARARVQLHDSRNAAAPRMLQVESRSKDPAQAFASFRALRADPERAYAGLEHVSRSLADALAESLTPATLPVPAVPSPP